MRVYLVVDEYQYDGGYVVLGIHTNPTKALEHQQKTRFGIWHDGQSKVSYSYWKQKQVKCESIRIHEMDVVE